MAKSQAIILFVTALCFLSLIGISQCHDDRFFVEGQVYCDTCRAGFVTRVSEYIEGAKVRLECRNITGGEVIYDVEGVTEKQGRYSLPVDGDYEDDICEIQLVESPKPECNEIPTDMLTKQAAKVCLTSNNGAVDPIRSANPLGFFKKDPLPECPTVFKELGLVV